MKFVSLFRKIPWVFYILQAAVFAAGVAFVVLLPDVYINWDTRKVSGYLVGLLLVFAFVGYVLADVRGRKMALCVVETVVFGVIGAGLYPLFHLLLAWVGKVGMTSVMTAAEVALLAFLSVCTVLTFIKSSRDVFGLKKKVTEGVALALVCVFLAVTIAPLGGTFFRRYFRSYDFLTEPSVYVSGDGYAVLFGTTGPGTGSVTIRKDGAEKTYYDEDQGVQRFHSQIHSVFVPKDELDGATYYISSKQTLNSEDHCLRTGKEIKSKNYVFHSYTGTGDVSFLVVSDNQGTPVPTWKAVEKASKTKQYDFVLMLGDQSEMYNDVEENIIDSFLKVSGIASRGEMPVYATMGNHEFRGMIAPDLWKTIPTPSKDGEFYYTFSVGDAFFTTLDFGTDHDDDYEEKYGGIVNFNAYKDKEYEWLETVMAEKPYDGYRYNLILSHIPLVFDENVTAYEQVCSECKKTHDYKFKEFCDAAETMGVRYVVSGHTHSVPREVKSDKYSYTNLQTGSYYAGRAHFRNSIVHLVDGEITFEVYSSETGK